MFQEKSEVRSIMEAGWLVLAVCYNLVVSVGCHTSVEVELDMRVLLSLRAVVVWSPFYTVIRRISY